MYACKIEEEIRQMTSNPIIGGSESPCCCWEFNLGPLEEQLVPLATEASLQPPALDISYSINVCFYVYVEPQIQWL